MKKHDQSKQKEQTRSRIEGSFKLTRKYRNYLPPGKRAMICSDCTEAQTRFGPKTYLQWTDVKTGIRLEQYFSPGSSAESKAFRNFCIGMQRNPRDVTKFALGRLKGLKAIVQVETVTRKYATGTLKGKPMPEVMNYSKVAEILKALGWVDLNQMLAGNGRGEQSTRGGRLGQVTEQEESQR